MFRSPSRPLMAEPRAAVPTHGGGGSKPHGPQDAVCTWGDRATHLGDTGPPRSAAETFRDHPGGDGAGCTSRSETPSALREQMSLVLKLIIDSGISWSGVGH